MADTENIDTNAGTILVVDDVPANLGALFEFLGASGFKVLVAESGRGALEQLRYAKPDLILLDMIMPGMDGLAVCRRVKSEPATRHIPVIFMTALAETIDKVSGFAAGAVDYVTKPAQPEEVLARVRAHLEIRRLQMEIEKKNRELEHEIELRRSAESQLQDSLDQAIVVATRSKEIHFCTSHAADLLARHFGDASAGVLPSEISDWIDGPDAGKRFEHRSERGTLSIILFRGEESDTTFVMRLEERVEVAGPEPLQKLGLTPREAEVLFWLTQGKTSPEIAIILEAAPNTVRKHVQNIFQKLGVENRTAAALKALEVLGLPAPEQ